MLYPRSRPSGSSPGVPFCDPSTRAAEFNDGLVTASTKLHLVFEGKIMHGNSVIKKYNQRKAVAGGQQTLDQYAASDL